MRRRLFFRQCTCDRMLVEWSSNQITSLQTSSPHLKICAVDVPWWGWWLALPCVRVLRCFSHVRIFVTSWTVAHQAPLPLGFSRQYWSGWPHPPLQGSFQPRSQTHASCISCMGKFFPAEPRGKPQLVPPVAAKCWAPSFQEAKRRGDSRQQEIIPAGFSPGSRATEG